MDGPALEGMISILIRKMETKHASKQDHLLVLNVMEKIKYLDKTRKVICYKKTGNTGGE